MQDRANRPLTILSWLAIFFLASGIFLSVSLSAAFHLLIIFPAIFSFYILRKSIFQLFTPSMFSLLFLCVTMVASVISNWQSMLNPWNAIFKIKYFAIGVFSIFPIAFIMLPITSGKMWKRLLFIFLIVTSLASVSGMIGLWTGINPLKWKAACHPDRACGMYGMYMTYGYGISLLNVLLIGLVLYGKQLALFAPWKVTVPSTIINLLGLFFSYTRGGWIGTLVGAMAYGRDLSRLQKKIFLIIFSIALTGIVFKWSKIVEVFTSRSGSDMQRISFYKAAFYAWKENPIFGIGYRNFEPNSKAIKIKYGIEHDFFGGHAHNNYFEHLASTGIIGLLALLIFLASWYYEAWCDRTILGRCSLAFVLSLTVSGLFQYTLGDGENLFLIFGFYAIWKAFSIRIFVKEALPKS